MLWTTSSLIMARIAVNVLASSASAVSMVLLLDGLLDSVSSFCATSVSESSIKKSVSGFESTQYVTAYASYSDHSPARSNVLIYHKFIPSEFYITQYTHTDCVP